MKYYDVDYISPAGNSGIHTAVEAESVIEAATKSPIMLSYGTPWRPEQWTVIAVIPTPKHNMPMSPEEHKEFMRQQNSIVKRILRFFRLKFID
jgi:hypothetical protein